MELDTVELEYQKLRDEVVSRIEIRSQTIFGVVTLAGVLYSFGISNPVIALMYPIVSLFLAASWTQNDISIKLIGKYIRDEIEPQVPGLKWQTWRVAYASTSTSVFGLRLTSLSAAGVFIITQAVALTIGFAGFRSFTYVGWLVGGLSILSTLLTVVLLREYNRHIKTQST
jgi:hypothetical protein